MNNATMMALFDFKDLLGDLEYRLMDIKTTPRGLTLLATRLSFRWKKLAACIEHEITQL